ncbi:MAG: Smr/MutS family protein [Deltaproteobacteria bacterium]|nr:Smr/MutS family protein [Deltaproteobacteria bacterium]
MRRRQRDTRTTPAAPDAFHHQPFRHLKARPAAPPPPTPVATPPPAAPPPSEDALFEREMAGVRPLTPHQRQRVVPPPPAPLERAVTDPDAEALAELSDLVTGAGPFDIADTVEFVEGAVAGLDRRLVRRLRSGDFAYQSHLDLHGLTAEEARVAVDRFLNRAVQQGQRCVLIIHGRGLNSKDHVPVLKHRLAAWLARGAWARLVLAFTSARAVDGGAGALYVLLRRQRRPGGKQPINVTHGAKW